MNQKVGFKARRGRKHNPVPHKPHHRATAYSRVGRLLKQRVALRHAPTIAEGLSEGDVQLKLHPTRTGLLIMAGATGLSADYTRRASTAATASPRPGRTDS